MACHVRAAVRAMPSGRRVIAFVTVLLLVTVALLSVFGGAASAAPPPPPSQPAAPPAASPPTVAPADPCQVAAGQPRPPQCIPQPAAPGGTAGGPAAPGAPAAPQPPTGVGGWIVGAISAGIEWFFRGVIASALNPLLELMGRTLLSTPTPDEQPRLGELWDGTRLIAVSAYVLLVMLGGIVVMGHETVQTRHSAKEIAPRIVLGFLGLNLSLWIAGVAAGLANALARAVLGGGVDPDTGAVAMRELVTNAMDNGGGLWLVFIALALVVMVVVLIVTYVIRIAMFAILIVAAPLALACHALPQTEGIAYWWWRAFGAVLAVQLGQSLTLAVALRVFFLPGGFRLFGDGGADGWVNLFLCIALLIILIKIPFWMLGAVRVSKGRSMIGTAARAFVAYKTFGLIRNGGARVGAGLGGLFGRGGRGGSGGGVPSGPPDPYAHPRTTREGQYLLPLGGLRRSPRPTQPRPPARPAANANRGGTQLQLPMSGEWPDEIPVLGRDGQYRLPFDVTRVPRTPPPLPPVVRRPRVEQLRFPPGGEWPDEVPVLGRDGQYRLPIEVKRVPRTPPPPPSVRRPRSQQLRFPPDGVWPKERRRRPPRPSGGQP